MSLRNRASDKLSHSLLIVGHRMKRGACECSIYREEDGHGGKPLTAQRARVAYLAPGQALLAPANDVIIKSDPRTGVPKAAVAMHTTQVIRKGKFLRNLPVHQYCPHRFVCPRCPWQHIDPLAGPTLKLNMAQRVVAVALGNTAKAGSESNGVETGEDTAASANGSIEWLDPLPFPIRTLRSRAVTFYFGVSASGSYALGVPISDFFAATRGTVHARSQEDDQLGEELLEKSITGVTTVESVSEHCAVLSPTQREVASRLERLWTQDATFRKGSQGDDISSTFSLKNVTLVESSRTRSMLIRVTVGGRDSESNALRSYSDASSSLSALEGKLVDAILKACVTCEGGVQIEVIVEETASSKREAMANTRVRQLYPRIMPGPLPEKSGSCVKDLIDIVLPTSADCAQMTTSTLSTPLISRGAGLGMFRYVGGVEAVIAAAIARASQTVASQSGSTQGSGDSTTRGGGTNSLLTARHLRTCSLVDFPTDDLSSMFCEAAAKTGLWEVSRIVGSTAFASFKESGGSVGEFLASVAGPDACLITRIYGGGGYKESRSLVALSKSSHLFGNTVALCEDADALKSLFRWFRERGLVGILEGAAAAKECSPHISVALVDVDPMSHHFSAIVSWSRSIFDSTKREQRAPNAPPKSGHHGSLTNDTRSRSPHPSNRRPSYHDKRPSADVVEDNAHPKSSRSAPARESQRGDDFKSSRRSF